MFGGFITCRGRAENRIYQDFKKLICILFLDPEPWNEKSNFAFIQNQCFIIKQF